MAVVVEELGRRLEQALRDGLREVGIEATVETERVPDSDAHRVLVLSPQFEHLDIMERQEVLWRIVRDAFSQDEQFRISAMLGLTPDEIEGKA